MWLSAIEHRSGIDRQKSPDPSQASHSRMDRRSQRTRQALHTTLIQLVIERGYDAISVSDIVEAANVGRSTFYAHFTDKDDLLRGLADTLRAVLVSEHALAAAAAEAPDVRVLGFSRFMTRHMREQHQVYRALMQGRAGPIILGNIRQALCEIVRKELPADAGSNRELTVQFLVGAYLSVLTWWLDRGATETPEQIEAAFRDLAVRGFLQVGK